MFSQTLGTVYGGGFECGTGKVNKFEGSTDGIWNKVPKIFNLICGIFGNLGDLVCPLIRHH